jgi:hypothetical protein
MSDDATTTPSDTTESQVADSATPSPESGGTSSTTDSSLRERANEIAAQVMPEPGDAPQPEDGAEPEPGPDETTEDTPSGTPDTPTIDDQTREYGRAAGLTDDQIDGLGSDQAVRYVANQQINLARSAPAGQVGDVTEPEALFERLSSDDIGFSVPDGFRSEYGDEAADAMQSWANGMGKTLIERVNGVIDRLNEYDSSVIEPIERANRQRQTIEAVDRIGNMIASTPGISPEARAIFGSGPAGELSEMQFGSRREVLDAALDLRSGMQSLGRTVPSHQQAVMMVLMERGLIGNTNQTAARQVPEPPAPPPRRGTPLGRPGQGAPAQPTANGTVNPAEHIRQLGNSLVSEEAFRNL